MLNFLLLLIPLSTTITYWALTCNKNLTVISFIFIGLHSPIYYSLTNTYSLPVMCQVLGLSGSSGHGQRLVGGMFWRYSWKDFFDGLDLGYKSSQGSRMTFKFGTWATGRVKVFMETWRPEPGNAHIFLGHARFEVLHRLAGGDVTESAG